MISRTILLVGLAALGAAAQAQLTPFTLEAGYFHSSSFASKSGGSTHLSGLELGASQTVFQVPMAGEIRVGGSILFGGTLGGGARGTLWRARALYKTPSAGPEGLYGFGGFNFMSAQGDNSFSSQSGFGVEAGIGLPLKNPVPGVPSPSIELSYRLGPKNQMRGLSAGVSVRF